MKIFGLFVRMYHRLQEKKKCNYLDGLVRKGLHLGENVAIIDTFFFDPSHCFLISIGDNCTICPNVRLIAHDASTKGHLGYTKIGRIDVRANCFIGDSTLVLPGVTIGPNSIVGAGSIVKRDIPPYSVAAGNPARVICSLDEYLEKMRLKSKDKKIFNEGYFIDRIDDEKKKELLDSLANGMGFIL